MTIKKVWFSKKGISGIFFTPKYVYTGYFLFGIIPLYISRELNY